MNRIIIADDQAIFRAGAARVLALEHDMSLVAQCMDTAKLWAAIAAFRGSILLVSLTLGIEPAVLLERTTPLGIKSLLIVENTAEVSERTFEQMDGVIARSIAANDLVDCVRRVAKGQRLTRGATVTTLQVTDTVGAKVRDRLTPKEMQIVSLIVQGCKNREIASRLGTKEQVIKNYLRSIYDKSGVSDRLELALFTIHHRVLAEAAAKAGSLLQKKTA